MKKTSVIAIFFAMLLGLAVATKVVAKTTINTDLKVFDHDDDHDSDDDDDDDDEEDDDDWLEDDEDDEE